MDPQELLDRIRELFKDKFHLDLPPDIDPVSFERDLYAALHGHPGFDLVGQGDTGYDDDDDDIDEDVYDEDDEDDEPDFGEEDEDEAREEQPNFAGRLSHTPRPKGRLKRLRTAKTKAARLSASRKRGQRLAIGGVSPQRGKAAAAEICRNVGL
jgi:hypothetical protein